MQIYALERDKYRDYQKRNNQIRSAIRKSKLTTNMYASRRIKMQILSNRNNRIRSYYLLNENYELIARMYNYNKQICYQSLFEWLHTHIAYCTYFH